MGTLTVKDKLARENDFNLSVFGFLATYHTMKRAKKATNIYILSIPRIPGEYKLGIHNGDLQKLYQRYETSVHDVQVHYFFKNVDAFVVEQQILKRHDKLRISKKRTDRKSEWMTIGLDELLLDLMMAFIGNPTGRDQVGTFIVDNFKRTKEGETHVLEASGNDIPLGKADNDYTTSSEEESSESFYPIEELSDDDKDIIKHMHRARSKDVLIHAQYVEHSLSK